MAIGFWRAARNAPEGGLTAGKKHASSDAIAPSGTTLDPARSIPDLAVNLMDVRSSQEMTLYELENQIRGRCSGIYLGNNRALARVFGRYSMYLNTRDVGFAAHLLLNGSWELPIAKFIISQISPGDTVVDIGANYGYYSMIFSDCVGADGRCICFEPNPLIVSSLRNSLALNGFADRSVVHEIALSEEAGAVTFFVPHNEPKNGHILGPLEKGDPSTGTPMTVNQEKGDRLLKAESRVDFIKIDAEGSEAAILKGLSGIIERRRPKILIEVNAARDYDLRAMLAYLTSVYREMRFVTTDATLEEIDAETVLSDDFGTDRMLFFGGRESHSETPLPDTEHLAAIESARHAFLNSQTSKLMDSARRAQDERDWPRAQATYQKFLERQPLRGDVWVQYGHAAKESGNLQEAERAYRRALSLNPGNADTHLQLGHLLKISGRLDEAAHAYAEALTHDPTFSDAESELSSLKIATLLDAANAARDERDWPRAQATYREFLEVQPLRDDIWVQYGHAAKESGNLQEAERAYRRALSLNPRNADSHLQLGHLLKISGRLDEAAHAYAEALAHDPSLSDAQKELMAISPAR